MTHLNYADKQVREAFEVSLSTIERTRKTFALEGLTAALTSKKRSWVSRQKFDAEKTAHLIALACLEPPEGHTRWTLRLLAEKMVELRHFSSISHKCPRQVLKKPTPLLARAAVVYPPRGFRGVRESHGSC